MADLSMCQSIDIRENALMSLLTRPQRLMAWVGFVATALMSPIAAAISDDASWLFSACVAGIVAIVILADDRARRGAGESD